MDSDVWNVIWIGGHVKTELLTSLNPFQRVPESSLVFNIQVNHFPRTIEITRKDRLLKNIRRMKDMHGAKHFDFTPRSYSLPKEYDLFKADFSKSKSKENLSNTWIVKPINLSRGRGIFVTNNLNEVPTDQEAVVQKFDRLVYIFLTFL